MTATLDTLAIARIWIGKFVAALKASDASGASALFLRVGYWRDLLSLSWNLRTLHGRAAIEDYLLQGKRMGPHGLTNLKVVGQPAFEELSSDLTWISAFFEFETPVARGQGVLRLKQDPDTAEWLAFTFYTGIEELKGHEEHVGTARPEVLGLQGKASWQVLRKELTAYADRDPEVLIIGAGQAGLTAAARLSQLGVDALVIEKNPRVGDNWRNRYDTLTLHDPVWNDHMPYVPFPETWPTFAPKDKVGDWLESYAKTLDLNIWTSTILVESSYDEVSNQWAVAVERPDGTRKTLRPKHIILATSIAGEAYIPTFKGSETFKGALIHSTKYKNAHGFGQKKVVIVGAGNSATDIAQDLYRQGADVTIVQRSSTLVSSSAAILNIYFKGLYDGTGPPTEVADRIGFSLPWAVGKSVHTFLTNIAKGYDAALHEGLQKAGFKVDFGPGGSGILYKYLDQRGSYLVDTGCGQLIIDGKIKVKQGHEIDHFEQDGVVFDDGTKLDADAVILATGYHNMGHTAAKLFGEEVAARAGEVWGVDNEGELKGIWRPSGHPGLWYHSGGLALCRFYSKRLALQVKANLLGLARL
ncbi:hypothetical protein BOTBODRAFT_171755 [Botryobasidium botryosum FD-172 SS1]|uniref:FAD/NAD(P)-binding domain-containing protein n=1 Tax=Botryobasidium botryosum (strain FD-172 SS1) TaxID=930990 RepID=A0A067N2R9_BOTB1|nr:hypothetical protein BOTBODRAFT_171755 [Botryobasidium botryosum FD-172 SS1]